MSSFLPAHPLATHSRNRYDEGTILTLGTLKYVHLAAEDTLANEAFAQYHDRISVVELAFDEVVPQRCACGDQADSRQLPSGRYAGGESFPLLEGASLMTFVWSRRSIRGF